MIHVGVVGLGFMAATHLKAYRQVTGARVAALCNPSGRHLDGDFSGVGGNLATGDPLRLDMTEVAAYRSVDDLLADPGIDLIDICAPTPAHHSLALAALKSGKHVLCEKPLARTASEADELVKAAEKSGGFFMPAMCLRFWPEWAWLKQAIERADYGKVLSARFRRVAEPPGWGRGHFFDGKQSGGALLDLHIHDTDFVQYCFGFPTRVDSAGYSSFSGAIDHVVSRYEVASGAMVFAEGSWAMAPGFGFNMSYTVNFERATADYDIARGQEALKLSHREQSPEIVTCPGPDGFVRELQYFVDCIAADREPSVVTAAEAADSVRICEMEEQSVLTGKPVSQS